MFAIIALRARVYEGIGEHACRCVPARKCVLAGGNADPVPMPPLADGLGVAGVGYLFALRRGRGVPA